MQTDPIATLLIAIKQLLKKTLPNNLAANLERDIESKVVGAFKNMSLVPKHEFEAQRALLQTLEAQIAQMESQLDKLQSTANGDPTEMPRTSDN